MGVNVIDLGRDRLIFLPHNKLYRFFRSLSLAVGSLLASGGRDSEGYPPPSLRRPRAVSPSPTPAIAAGSSTSYLSHLSPNPPRPSASRPSPPDKPQDRPRLHDLGCPHQDQERDGPLRLCPPVLTRGRTSMATTASPASPRSCTRRQLVIVDPVVDIITVHYKCVKLWIKMKPRCPTKEGDLEGWRGAGRDVRVRDLPRARMPSRYCSFFYLISFLKKSFALLCSLSRFIYVFFLNNFHVIPDFFLGA